MSNIIDFVKERAKRKSGIHDPKLLEDIIDTGFDPSDPVELDNYYSWKNFEGQLNETLYTDDAWTDEAIQRLLADIKAVDPDQPYPYTVTIDANFDDTYEFNFDSDEEKG